MSLSTVSHNNDKAWNRHFLSDQTENYVQVVWGVTASRDEMKQSVNDSW